MKFLEVGPLPRCARAHVEHCEGQTHARCTPAFKCKFERRINAFLDHVSVADAIVCGNLEAYSCASPTAEQPIDSGCTVLDHRLSTGLLALVYALWSVTCGSGASSHRYSMCNRLRGVSLPTGSPMPVSVRRPQGLCAMRGA